MILILLNCHATLCYCVQSQSMLFEFLSQFIKIIYLFAVALTDTQAKIPLKHKQSFVQFYKLCMCSVPVAMEHCLCDALYVSPTIAYLISMTRSRCVNLNLIHPELCINCQSSDDIHSEQFWHRVKTALYSRLY